MLGFTAFTPTCGSLKDASGVDIVDTNGQKIKNPEMINMWKNGENRKKTGMAIFLTPRRRK